MVAWFSIAPDDGTGSYSQYVADAIALLKKAGLTYRLGAMGTEVEGPRDKVYSAIAQCHELFVRRPGVRRIEVVIKVDDRLGVPEGQLARKVESVEGKLAD